MTITLTDDEAYHGFLVVDTDARRRLGLDPYVNHLRERLLPVYREWHAAHPFKVHPPLELPTGNREV